MNGIPETDWKYLRSIKGELLEACCKQINDEALRIITDPSSTQHEKFLRLHSHLMEKNEVVADCFDDWRRSNILLKLLMLRSQRLLRDEHVSRLSAETQDKILSLTKMNTHT